MRPVVKRGKRGPKRAPGSAGEMELGIGRIHFPRTGLTVLMDLNVYQPDFADLGPGASEVVIMFETDASPTRCHVLTGGELQLLLTFLSQGVTASKEHQAIARAWDKATRRLERLAICGGFTVTPKDWPGR